MSVMPLLDVEYLAEDQLVYECQLRDLPFDPMTPANILLLKRKVTQYLGDPTQLSYINTTEGQQQEFTRCIAGLKLFLTQYQTFSYEQRLNRVLHFYYRLKRLTLVNTPRWTRYITRVGNLFQAIQGGPAQASLPADFHDWARSVNITTDTIEPEENATASAATATRNTGAKPKSQTHGGPMGNSDKAGASKHPTQLSAEVQNPVEDLHVLSDLHSTMLGPARVSDEVIRVMDKVQRRQEEMAEQTDRRMNDMYMSVMEALRAMKEQQQPQQYKRPKQSTRQPTSFDPPNSASPYNNNVDPQPQQQDQPPFSHFDQPYSNPQPPPNKSNYPYSSQNPQPNKSNQQYFNQNQQQNKSNYPYSSQQPKSNNQQQGHNRQQPSHNAYNLPPRHSTFMEQPPSQDYGQPPNAPSHQPFTNNRYDGRFGYNGQSNWNWQPGNPNANEYMPNYNTHFQYPFYSTQDPNVNSSSTTGRDTVLTKLQQLPRWQCRFSGNNNDNKNQTLNDYIASIQNFIKTVDLSPHDMMRNIYPTLKDEALHFYLTLPTDDMGLEEFFLELRNRFGDKRGAASAVVDLIKNKLDERGSIHGHIDEMIFRMRMLPFNWSEAEQLDIIRQTLPDNYLKPIVYRGIANIRQLKEFCLEAFPTNSSNRRRSERDYKKTKVMSLEVVSEEEAETESETEDDPIEKICSVIKQWEKKTNFKRNDKLKSNFSKTDSHANHKKNNNEDKPKPKKPELFCGNCLTEGHSHHTCKNPKRIYCYHCGTAGSTVNNCESEACKQSKNE